MSRRKLILANNPLISGPAFSERERIGTPYRLLPIEQIDVDPNQPRKTFDTGTLNELAESIKTYGVLSPILVRPSKIHGRFTLVAGERRLRAAALAGLKSVPVVIDQTDDTSVQHTLALQLVENLQRDDLPPLERAAAIKALRDAYGLSIRDIASRLGISKSSVQRSLDLFNLPQDLLNAIKMGVPESKVLLLADVKDEEARAKYLSNIEAISRSKLKTKISAGWARNRDIKHQNPEDKRIVEEIQEALGLKVKLIRSRVSPERGRLVIDLYSGQDLQEIFSRLVRAH